MSPSVRKRFEKVFTRTNGEKKWYLFVSKNGDSIVFDKTRRPMTFEQCHFYQNYIGKKMPLVEVFARDSEAEIEKIFKEEKYKYEKDGIITFKL